VAHSCHAQEKPAVARMKIDCSRSLAADRLQLIVPLPAARGLIVALRGDLEFFWLKGFPPYTSGSRGFSIPCILLSPCQYSHPLRSSAPATIIGPSDDRVPENWITCRWMRIHRLNRLPPRPKIWIAFAQSAEMSGRWARSYPLLLERLTSVSSFGRSWDHREVWFHIGELGGHAGSWSWTFRQSDACLLPDIATFHSVRRSLASCRHLGPSNGPCPCSRLLYFALPS